MMVFFASALGFLKRVPWQAWAIVATLAALFFGARFIYNDGYDTGVADEQARWQAKQVEAQKVQAESANEATAERIIETRTITIKQKARDNAIQATDDDKPSAASNALNCERLRTAGTDVQHIPACGGRSGGTEAPTAP